MTLRSLFPLKCANIRFLENRINRHGSACKMPFARLRMFYYIHYLLPFTPQKPPLFSFCLYLSHPWKIVQRVKKTKVPRSNPCSYFASDKASCFGIVENRVNPVHSMSMDPSLQLFSCEVSSMSRSNVV